MIPQTEHARDGQWPLTGAASGAVDAGPVLESALAIDAGPLGVEEAGMRSTMGWIGAVAVMLLASPTMWSQTRPAPGAVLYEGARLILGDGQAPIDNGAFLVQAGRFTAVGRAGSIAAPDGAGRVALTGKTVMPAMVDVDGARFDREGLLARWQKAWGAQ